MVNEEKVVSFALFLCLSLKSSAVLCVERNHNRFRIRITDGNRTQGFDPSLMMFGDIMRPYETLEHSTSNKGQFCEIEIYASSET